MDDLKMFLEDNGALPYLFIGSGVSKRYLNTPTWYELLEILCERIGAPIAMYRLRAEGVIDSSNRNQSNYLNAQIATEIERDYNDCFFSRKNQYFATRYAQLEPYFNDINFNPFKRDICALFEDKLISFDQDLLKENQELRVLSKINSHNVAGVITTNYDAFLENIIFKEHETIIGNDKLLITDIIGIDELYKIHGCVTEPDNIIINSDDYNRYNSKQTYLAAKLMTIFVEHPIIFIGFGLKDPNVDNLLTSLVTALSDDQIDILSSKLVIIEWDPSALSPTKGTYNFNGLQIQSYRMNDYTSLFTTLYNNRASYNPALYKRFKKSIYEMVRTNKPSDVIEIPSDTSDEQIKNGRMVIGFAQSSPITPLQGITGLTYIDLFEDLVFDNKRIIANLNSKQLVHLLYTAGLHRNYSIPLMKYEPYLGEEINQDLYNRLKKKVEIVSGGQFKIVVRKKHIHKTKFDLATLFGSEDTPKEQLHYILAIKCLKTSDQQELMDIFDFAKNNFNDITSSDSKSYRKLLSVLDYVKHKKNPF